MTELIDIDMLEQRVREKFSTPGGMVTFAPSAVLELIGRLRAAEKLIGQREVAQVEAALGLNEDACNCDDTLALQARVRELEQSLALAESGRACAQESCHEPERRLMAVCGRVDPPKGVQGDG